VGVIRGRKEMVRGWEGIIKKEITGSKILI